MRRLALLVALAPVPFTGSATAQRLPDLRVDRDSGSPPAESWRPDLAISGNNLYVCWMDYRHGDMDIFFNRSTDGGRSWLPADVRLDVGTAPGASWSSDPVIAAAGDTVVVAWRDFRNGTFPHVSGIFVNRSVDGGITWLPSDIRINVGATPGTTGALDHAIAIVGNSVHAIWEDQRAGDRNVYYNRSLDGGATWGATDVRLDIGKPAGSVQSIQPELAVAGSRVHVAWSDFRNSTFSGDIYYNGSADGGATWLPTDVRLDHSTTVTFGGSILPKIAASDDTVYSIWHDNRHDPGPTLTSREVYFNRSLDGGLTWLPADVRLNTSTPPGSMLTEFSDLVATGSDVHAVWIDRRHPRTVAYQRSTDRGATWQPSDVPLSTPPANSYPTVDVPRLATSGPLVLATWAENRGPGTNPGFDIFYNTSTDAGATWLPQDRRLDTGDPAGAKDSFLPVPSFLSTVPYVVWQDERGDAEDIYLNQPFGSRPYGTGKPGAGGFEPAMTGSGLSTIGQTVQYGLDDGVGGGLGLFTLGIERQSAPALGGTLHVVPLAHLWFVLGGPSGVPGAGSIGTPLTLPNDAALRGLGIFVQGFVFDSAATFGLSMSDGLEFWIG